MLVIVEYRDIKKFFQTALNLKTARGRDIFQVDSAESRCNIDNCLNNLFCILSVQADRNCVDSAEFFEKNCFSFHNRHGGFGSDVTKSENGTTIGYYSDCVGFHRVFVGCIRVLCNDLAWLGNAWCICDCEVFTRVYV